MGGCARLSFAMRGASVVIVAHAVMWRCRQVLDELNQSTARDDDLLRGEDVVV